MITIHCPKCKAQLKAPASFAGQVAQCPQCGSMIRAPKAKPKPTAAPRPAAPKPRPAAAAKPTAASVGAKSSLAAELDSIADEVLGQEAPAKRAPAKSLTASRRPAAKPAGKRKKIRPGKPTPTRPAARKKRSFAGLYIALFGVAAVGGTGYFLVTQIRTRLQVDRDQDAVTQILAEAENLYEDEEYEEAQKCYEKAILAMKEYKKTHTDGFFDDRLDEIEEFLEKEQAYREVWAVLQKAETARQGSKYVDAKKFYLEAKKKAQSQYQLTRDERMEQFVELATKALASDEIRLGSQGWVFYAGKWMTKEEQFATEMVKQGKTRYNGEWLTKAEIDKLKKAEAAKLAAKIKDRMAARAKAAKGKTPAIKKIVKRPRRPADPPADPGAEIWMFDDFESSTITWNMASWGNKGTTSLVKVGKSTVLKMDYTKRAGNDNKFVIQKRIPKSWDLATRDQILLDMKNEGKAAFQLALAFQTRDWEGFYESRGRYIKTGESKNIMFDLREKRFKCEATGWAHKSELRRVNEIGMLLIMIYPKQPGTVTLDNVRFVKKK